MYRTFTSLLVLMLLSTGLAGAIPQDSVTVTFAVVVPGEMWPPPASSYAAKTSCLRWRDFWNSATSDD